MIGKGVVLQKLDLSTAKDKILDDIRRYVAEVQSIIRSPVETVEGGIRTLVALRKTSYEDLNQIQHEYAALRRPLVDHRARCAGRS
jgi:hypothetical protein